MGRKIKIIQDYHGDNIKLYKKRFVELQPGLTVLVGCNGIGKTTLLKQIKSGLREANIPCLDFDNLHSGGSNARTRAAFYGDFSFVAQGMCSSEGENIVLNMQRFAGQIGCFFKENIEAKEIWVLLDAVDSGLSIDAVEDLKEGLFKTIFEHYSDKEIYIVCSANEYELARGEMCFDVANCKYVPIKSYEKYRSVIMRSRKIKDERYERRDDK